MQIMDHASKMTKGLRVTIVAQEICAITKCQRLIMKCYLEVVTLLLFVLLFFGAWCIFKIVNLHFV